MPIVIYKTVTRSLEWVNDICFVPSFWLKYSKWAIDAYYLFNQIFPQKKKEI